MAIGPELTCVDGTRESRVDIYGGLSHVCRLEEWAGGYDGFWDVNADSGHEPGVSAAIRQMLNAGNDSAPSQFRLQSSLRRMFSDILQLGA